MEQNPILHTTLSLDSDIPLYAQLVGIIKRNISTGALSVGDLLPSEAELCRSLNISRNTVRQAIGELEDEGLVIRKRGRGTFVSDPSATHRGVRYSFTTEVSSLGKVPSSTLVDFTMMAAPAEVCGKMELRPGTPVYADGLAHRVAADAQGLTELRLAGQQAPHRQCPRGDAALDDAHQLGIQRDIAVQRQPLGQNRMCVHEKPPLRRGRPCICTYRTIHSGICTDFARDYFLGDRRILLYSTTAPPRGAAMPARYNLRRDQLWSTLYMCSMRHSTLSE